MTTYKDYAKEIQTRIGERIAWPLNQSLALGDVGFFDDGNVFQRQGNLSAWNIAFRPREGARAPYYHYASEGAVTLGGALAATGEKVAIPASGKLELGFNRTTAVFLRLGDQRLVEIEDKLAVGAAILEMYRAGGWDAEHVVVTSLMTARTAALLVSGSAGAKAMLEVDATDLGAAGSGKLTLASSSSLVVDTVAKADAKSLLTPLFRTQGVVKRFLRGSSFRSGDGTTDDASLAWDDVNPDA